MNMRERIAKALAADLTKAAGEHGCRVTVSDDMQAQINGHVSLPALADAILAALREPPPEAIERVAGAICCPQGCHSEWRNSLYTDLHSRTKCQLAIYAAHARTAIAAYWRGE